MSASSKKKLRNEQASGKMTEKQIAEQKEARKLKLYTIAFVAVLVVLLVVAICVGISKSISNSGIRERNTTALTLGEHKISNAELNYFYIDAVNNFLSSYGSYASMFGLDVTKPLNEQILEEDTGYTWADDFLSSARENARSVYALADEAEANGFALSEEELSQVETTMSNLDAYAALYGYQDANAYLKAMYGNGASKDSYLEYYKRSTLADAYYSNYSESLTYEDADLRAAEEENYSTYSSFTYNQYYLSASKFLTGGTTDENGTTTYSEEEKAASVSAAEEAAKALTGDDITSVEDLDAAISALDINAASETPVTSTAYEDNRYTSISSSISEWLADSARAEGDKTYIANSTTSTDDAGNETTTVNGYYVIYFVGRNDNTFPLVNVRHILVGFEGGTTDANGSTTYSDEEKAAAKTKAEELLAQWKSGEATEDSFAQLANENSTDPGSNTNGGLYEDIYPGQMVTAFEDWCYDDSRKAGDTGIIETTYGYHIMYFVGQSDITYRDFLITNDLTSADVSEWYTSLVDAMTVTEGDDRYIRKDLVLSAS